MEFGNVYEDPLRAAAYSMLDFPGTYYLAYRDLPKIIFEHVTGRRALDFGCGTGRSTRFLIGLGFDTVGVDVSRSMVDVATKLDPSGNYQLVDDGDFSSFEPGSFDLVLSAFAFDNIPGVDHRCELLRGLGRTLRKDGRIVVLGSTPEIYRNEWASFTTKDHPENRNAEGGEQVRIVMKDVEDARPVVDLIWFHEDYASLFAASELDLLGHYLPLGFEEEPYEWVSETSIAPWVVYVLGKNA